ncbi:peroxiredoxin [Alkalihalophilus pseudofirmus]|uniref:peroxiredoxin n=1 Tax=Alkalihalophilus pseudofirmus TaxID=79885 RepID=UPI00259AEC4D|nr:peroxiredoxin [Alkalihalophilus pseudofirmus]WEG15317.1 peroxiredoxin [Alkalihalophilus pseudofirmus]
MDQPHQEIPPKIGDLLPTFVVQTTQGKKTLPDDYAGSWVMLFSHPGDFTPVCTTEFYSFATNEQAFQQLNTQLIGLSIDTVFAHMKWMEWIQNNLGIQINFPIIADELGNVAKRLGMIAPERGTTAVRSVFIIDPTGHIRIILNYPAEVGRNTNELLRIIHALQLADGYDVKMPANWPNNELIGDKVILAPPSDVMKVQKRIEEAEAGEVECFDWWFCYKDLPEES